MLRRNVRTKGSTKYEPPDIFRAAVNNDAYELSEAIRDGQSLLSRERKYARTPLHVAAQCGSIDFIRAATTYKDVDPWALDLNNYTAYDLAARRNDRDAQRVLFDIMYP